MKDGFMSLGDSSEQDLASGAGAGMIYQLCAIQTLNSPSDLKIKHNPYANHATYSFSGS
jgi:hypothetical protein